jgi:SprT protein
MVMLLFKQLEFTLSPLRAVPSHGRDPQLETEARELLRQHGADRLAARIHVSWNRRLQSAAGKANYRAASVTLNPRLRDHDIAEIDRTLRHELAHLLAQFRAGRRRIAPHGEEWREACRDLGIADEKRCHALAFPIRRHRGRFVYQCPKCRREITRTRLFRRSSACLACCRAFNRGAYDRRFRLRLVNEKACNDFLRNSS